MRRRVACASREEADFERARIVLEQTRGIVSTPAHSVPAAVGSVTVAEFWPTWLADARSRSTRLTVLEYERIFKTRVGPRFGTVALDGVRPRMVFEWRAELADAGVGPEAIRRAMVLLQAMFTVAIEWGETGTNPVTVVRKPRQDVGARSRRSPPRTSSACEQSSFSGGAPRPRRW